MIIPLVAAGISGCGASADALSTAPDDALDAGPAQPVAADASAPPRDAGASEVDAGTFDPGPPAALPPPPPPPPPPAPPPLFRAIRLNLVQSTVFPHVGQTEVTNVITGRITVQLAPSGPAKFHFETCDVQLQPNTNQIAIQFSPSAIRGFLPMEFAGDLPPLAIGASISLPTIVQLVGLDPKLIGPSDPLPTNPGPATLDADGDGNPGVTLTMSSPLSAQLYVVSRATLQMHGTVVTPDRFSGSVAGLIEQSTIGSNNSRVSNGILPTSPIDDPTRNTFLMVGVPSTAECADILAQAGALFQ